jgi:hypothetical protein
MPLTADQSVELGALLKPARRGRPRADQIGTGRWTGKDSNGPLR